MSDKKTSIFAGTAIAKGFETDHDAERAGVWRLHVESGLYVRVRRSTLAEHKRAIRKHYKPFAHLPRVDPKDELLVKQKAAAETLVADWAQYSKNMETGVETLEPLRGADGAPINATEQNVLAAFIEFPDFFAWLTDEADTFENYRIEAVKESAGNFARISGGPTNGEATKPQPSSNDEQLEARVSAPLSESQS